jgi:hypothetical protein
LNRLKEKIAKIIEIFLSIRSDPDLAHGSRSDQAKKSRIRITLLDSIDPGSGKPKKGKVS